MLNIEMFKVVKAFESVDHYNMNLVNGIELWSMDIPVSWSVVTAAVRPTPEDPRPVVATARGAVWST